MTDDINTRAAILRASRAYLGIDQIEASDSAGISQRTLIAAERGRVCTDKTFDKLTTVYAAWGMVVEMVDGAVVMQVRSKTDSS